MPMPDKAALRGKRFAMATTEKMALSNRFFADNMYDAAKLGEEAEGVVVNCFIYGDKIKTPEDAVKFITASGYRGNVNDIRLIDKNGRSFEEIVAAITAASGTGNIGISTEESELGAKTPVDNVKVLTAKEFEMDGLRIVPAINSYQTLLTMVTMSDDKLLEMVAEGRLPGVTYDDVTRIFRYLPKVLPLDYGRELRSYWNAINLIRSAA